jgi:hypothetical protein
VEELHSIKRKYADKWLNFERTYIIRANIALLANFINNWQNLILTRLKIYIGEFYNLYEEIWSIPSITIQFQRNLKSIQYKKQQQKKYKTKKTKQKMKNISRNRVPNIVKRNFKMSFKS